MRDIEKVYTGPTRANTWTIRRSTRNTTRTHPYAKADSQPQIAETRYILTEKDVQDMTQELGRGENGVTYLHDFGTVLAPDLKAVKIINIKDETQLKTEMKAVKLNRKCQKITYETENEKKRPCVCPIDYFQTITLENGSKMLYIIMPRMEPFEITSENLKNIFKACETLVKHNYFHNDFHRQNVMMYDGSPIIIDLGFMRYEKHNLRGEQLKELIFAQISSFLDNCNMNNNTECNSEIHQLILLLLHQLIQSYKPSIIPVDVAIANPDGTNVLTYAKGVAQYANTFNNETAFIRLQLVLAHLANAYFSKDGDCTYRSWCEEGSNGPTVGDLVYAIRNPSVLEQLITRFQMRRVGVGSNEEVLLNFLS